MVAWRGIITEFVPPRLHLKIIPPHRRPRTQNNGHNISSYETTNAEFNFSEIARHNGVWPGFDPY
jgi:hypothetical protein